MNRRVDIQEHYRIQLLIDVIKCASLINIFYFLSCFLKPSKMLNMLFLTKLHNITHDYFISQNNIKSIYETFLLYFVKIR